MDICLAVSRIVNERLERGLARQRSLGPSSSRTAAYDAIADIAPDLSRLAVEFAYGDIHSRPGLDADQRELVILGSLITQGGADAQIDSHLRAALGAGLTQRELVEAIIQATPYAGFPRVLAAMATAAVVFSGHQSSNPRPKENP